MDFSIYISRENLRAGLLVSLLSVWLLVGLFAYLNHFTKRRYFTLWTAAWLFYALWLTLDFCYMPMADDRPLQMIRHWCVGVSAVFLAWGSLFFMGQRHRQTTFGLFILFLLAWSYVAAYQVVDSRQATVPIFAILGLASCRTAYCFLVYRRRHSYVAAGLLAVGMALWGIYLGGYPLWDDPSYLRASSFFVCGVLQLFIAVSMIVLVLEETRAHLWTAMESDRTNRAACEGLESQVRSTEDRYRKLFEQASDGIVITGTGRLEILELNQRAKRLLMLPHLEPGQQSLASFLEGVPADIEPTRGAQVFEQIRQQRTLSLVAANGSKTPVEAEGSAIEFGGQAAYQFAFRELTERARLEQQLRQAEKLSALGQMVSGIAHELNNPLAVINGYLELVLSRDPLPDQTRQSLLKVATESGHAAKLVSNFLSFAREQASTRVVTDLNQLVERVAERRRLDPDSARILTRLELAPGLPQTLADPDKLEQVLDNLVHNAMQALSDRQGAGIVQLTTERFNGSVRVRVEDNGPGIPAHLAARIFEPFFTTKDVGKGTGLGLSISHSIMSEHKGRLYHQPSGLGGACFVAELPALKAAPADAARPPEAAATAAMPSSKNPPHPSRILILDDEKRLADMLEQIIQHLGHHTTVYCSPLEALREIEQRDFDVIFSDYRMPELDGRQFYQRVAQAKPHLASRIIFLTGDVANEPTRSFLSSVGNPCVTKPFHLRAVQSAINGVLEKQPGGGALPSPGS
jgi:PAS domain S-box-containing protein